MKVTVNTKFNVGDDAHEVFWDGDIDAWNVCSWKVEHVCIKVNGKKFVPVYWNGYANEVELGVDSAELFKTSLAAANEAKKRNHEMMTDKG